MSKDNTQNELKTAAEQCFIKNNMCDCGEVHIELSIDDTEYFDVGNVVEDIQSLVKSEVRQVLDRLESQTFGIKQDIPVSQYPARSVNEPEYVSAINQVISKSAIEAERKLYE